MIPSSVIDEVTKLRRIACITVEPRFARTVDPDESAAKVPARTLGSKIVEGEGVGARGFDSVDRENITAGAERRETQNMVRGVQRIGRDVRRTGRVPLGERPPSKLSENE